MLNASQQYEFKLSIIHFSFRTLLAMSLGGIGFADRAIELNGNYETNAFLATVSLYFCLCLANLLHTSYINLPPRKSTTFVAIIIDIAFCIAAMHLCGGFKTGLAILLLAPITIGSIFFSGSAAFFLAAIAIISMLLDVLYQSSLNPSESKYFIPAGLVGILLFATSLVIQAVARHIRSTEKLVSENIEITRTLVKLNETIVQRMQTGIIVINAKREIQLINDFAKSLLAFPVETNAKVQGKLLEQFNDWQHNPEKIAEPFRDGPALPVIKASFSVIDKASGDTIIFIENQSALNQQAQHIKLSSLGRLSASIAHEIRNPLNAISHASQLLLESENIPAEDMRLLDMINNHTKRINGIINNVLDISRRAATIPQKVEIMRIIEKIRQNSPEYINASYDIDVPEHFTVTFDESQLGQVMLNLIDNALRYSAEATGERWVRIIARENNGRPEVMIFDKGPGVPPDSVEKVFEPFYTTHRSGTGLGLYVARELCEMNQAILDYSYDYHGTGFFIIRFAHSGKNISL